MADEGFVDKDWVKQIAFISSLDDLGAFLDM